MKKVLAILLALGLLLGVSWAMAEVSAESNATAAGTEAISLTALNGTVTGGTATGSFYYKVKITLPEGAGDTIQFGWSTDPEAEAPDGWETVPLSEFDPGDSEREKLFVSYPGELEGSTYTDVVFVRLNDEDDNVTRLTLVYDLNAEDSSLSTHVSGDGMELLKPVTVTWDEIDGVDGYILCWTDPLGRTRWTFRWETSQTFDDVFYGGTANTVGYVGEYQFWVLPLKDGKKGVVPDDWHKYIDTITEPEPDERITFTAGASSSRLQESVHFVINAPGAAEMQFFAGYELWDWLEWDGNGRCELDWSPSEAGQVGRRYQFYAQVRFEGETDWVTSAVKTVRVLGYDEEDTLQGELTWSLMSGREMARDGMLELLVDRLEGAEYYAAYLMRGDDWVADSGWFDANPEGATPLTLPLLDCEAGESYNIYVYAVKIGVPQVESEHTESIRVTAPASQNKILVAMKNTFTTHEPLRISLDYTEKETLNEGWIHVKIVRADDRNNVWYENAGYPRFQDNGFSIDQSGDYLLLAAVYTNPDEPEQVASIEFPFTVSSDGALGPIALSGVPALHQVGEAMTVSVQEVEGAQWYDLMLHYIPENGDWEELENVYLEPADAVNGQLSHTFSRELFSRPGRYRVWARASAKGMDSSWDEKYVTALESIDQSLTLTANGESSLENYPANQEVRLTVSVPGAVAVRMLDEWGNWQAWDSRDFGEDGSFTWYSTWSSGTYTTVAQASYDPDPRYQDWDGFDWTDFDLNRDLTWTKSSNEVTMTFVSAGLAPKAVFTLDETVDRGRLQYLRITDASEGGVIANRFYVSVRDANGDEVMWVDDGEEKTLPAVIAIPTGNLQEGDYTAAVGSCLAGYDWMETEEAFTVTAPADPDAIILEVQEDPVSDIRFSISAFAPGATRMELWVLDKENRVSYEMYDNVGGDGYDNQDQRWHGGEYDLYVLARYEDEEGNELREPRQSEIVTVTVRYLGALEEPVIAMDSPLVQRSEGLTFTVHGLDQAEWYDIRILDEDARDPETGDPVEVARWTAEDGPAPETFTVPAEQLTAEHGYGIDVYVSRPGYRDNNSHGFFTVVESVQTSLRLESENGTEAVENWPCHKEISFRLYAPGAQAIRFLRFDGGWEYRDGCNQTNGWFTWTDWPERGEYTVVAQAAYDGYDFLHNDWDAFDWDSFDWNAAGFTWTAASNSIQVKAVSAGQLDAPRFTLDKSEVTRGEILTVHITELQGKNEWYDARLIEEATGWESENVSWFEETRTLSIPTAEATPGTYRLTVWANAEGMDGSEAFLPVTVREVEEGEIVFELSSETVLLHETVTVSVYARDAEHIGFALDGERWDLDAEGNYQWGDCQNSWQNREDIRWDGDTENGETHTLQAFALINGQWVPSAEKTVTVTVLGQVELDVSGLPATLTAGAAVELRFPFPDHAEGMQIELYEFWDDSEGFHDAVIHDWQDFSGNAVLTVPTENLNAGHRIAVNWNAWGVAGYQNTGINMAIPVTAAASDLVTVTAFGDNYDAETGSVLADSEFRIRVVPAAGHSLTAVRVYDGYGFWDGGADLTRDKHPDMFLADGSFEGPCSGFHEDRSYTVYAEARLDGGETWVRTNLLTLAVKTVGVIGAYDFADLSDLTVARGEAVTLRFTEAENATSYWADVFDAEQGYNPETTFEGTTVTLLTGSLPEGTYEIRGRAGGDPGYFWRESDSPRRLIISAPDIPASGIQVTFSKTEVETLEAFIVSVYAPGAERLRLCHSEEENVWWDEEGDSQTRTHWFAGGNGEQVLLVYAMFDGQWSEPVMQTINLVSSGHAPAATVTVTPAIARPGEEITVHVEKPQGAEYFDIWANLMRPDGEEWPVVIPYTGSSESRDYTIQTADLAEDDTIVIWVETYARGTESTQVEAHAIVSSLKDLYTYDITLTTPANLTEIGEEAFMGIAAKAVRISDRVTTIGPRAFAESHVRQIVIPASVTDIAEDAFEDNGAVVIFAPTGSYAHQWVLEHQDQMPVYFVSTGGQ